MNNDDIIAQLRMLSQLVEEFVERASDSDEEARKMLCRLETKSLIDAFGTWITVLPQHPKPCQDKEHRGTHWTYDHKVCLLDDTHVFCRKHRHFKCPICGGLMA